MTKRTFMKLLTQELTKYFPPEAYTIHSDVFVKNNDTRRHGIIIRRIEGKVAPTVYIDSLYDDYSNKKCTLEETALQIQAVVRGIDQYEGRYGSFSAELEDCRSKIIYRLVSQEKNEAYLSGIPHLPFLNLAIIFSVVHQLSEEGLESVCITNELQKKWGISTRDLYLLAAENTARILPANIDTMAHMLEAYREDLCRKLEESDHLIPHIYIVSNDYGINGAAVLLYENLIQSIAEKEKHNLFIVPSSIHEILIIPDHGTNSLSHLSEMIQEVNKKHVREDEILSDRAYYYDREEKKFIL